MATIPYSTEADRGEAKFFFTMACVMAASIVIGFAANSLLGRVSYPLPWVVHIHALVMIGWVALYVTQNSLIFADNVALHKRLGWLSLVWLPAITVMGIWITRHSLQSAGGPFFFDQNEFLFSNPLMLLLCVALAAAAVTVRRNTGWHRRLMYCSFAILTGPGIGRLMPNPLLEPYAWWIGGIGISLVFPIIGMIADKRRYGAIHPAWFVGIGSVIGLQVVADLLAYSAWGIEFTKWFLEGTPGSMRQMQAFLPPGM
jgi:hypothetical protein